ncbi:MAG: hypothetical protein AB7O98_06065 [Hyphomonadaceae bacterium]
MVLTASHADGLGRTIFNAALAWSGAAIVCMGVLQVWHAITHRFESFPTPTIMIISIMVGAFVGLFGATTASTVGMAILYFVTAALGSIQAGAIALLVVGSDLQAPPEMKSDPGDEDDTPNPPTSPP